MCIGNNFSNIFCSLMIYLIINRCILKVFLTKILIFIPIYENILIYATKKSLIYNQGLKRADDGNRTRDLRHTKATLYRLSHISTPQLLTQSTSGILTNHTPFVNQIIYDFFHKKFIRLNITKSDFLFLQKKNSLSIGCPFRRRYFYYGV